MRRIKWVRVFAILVMITLLAVAGCSTNAKPPTTSSPEPNAQPVGVTVDPNKTELTAAYDAAAPKAAAGKVVEVTLTAEVKKIEIAPGVFYDAWTFGGTVPGPVIRVKQGDTVKFTLVNKDPQMSHSMDFHAAKIAPNVAFKSIGPNESHSFEFKAEYPGVFMYHCGTPPILAHIANGMYGAIIVDPPGGWAPAREYVLVQSEWYKGPAEMEDMMTGDPQYVVFNGTANQYVQFPLAADVGEKVRLFVVNAGPTRFSGFHVVGTVFDRVYPDGNPQNLLRGIQTYTIPPGGGTVVEFTLPEAGTYPVVTHAFADATRGAVGIIRAGDPSAEGGGH